MRIAADLGIAGGGVNQYGAADSSRGNPGKAAFGRVEGGWSRPLHPKPKEDITLTIGSDGGVDKNGRSKGARIDLSVESNLLRRTGWRGIGIVDEVDASADTRKIKARDLQT